MLAADQTVQKAEEALTEGGTRTHALLAVSKLCLVKQSMLESLTNYPLVM